VQATKASNQTLWKQFFKDAILDLDPTSAEQKLEAAKNAIEDRLREIHARGGIDHRERMELEDAQRTILFLGKHEQQT
jgi:hypothetical protein